MIKPLTVADIKYICKHMMGVDWLPSFIEIPSYLNNTDNRKRWEEQQTKILRILSKCQSKLEVMYFLGIGYYLHGNGVNNSTSDDYPPHWPDSVNGQEGIHISEPFCGGRYGNGQSSLLVVPQYQSPEKPIHHDFGLFAGESNGGGPWHFYRVVEVEGYGVHKQRREADLKRYEGLSYPVITLYEESMHPQDWYAVLDPDIKTGIPGEDCFDLYCGDNELDPGYKSSF